MNAIEAGVQEAGVEQERKEFLAGRRGSLGSSDAAAVCGLSPWATPLHVYLSKVGQWDGGDSPPKQWGRRLEEVVGAAYMEETARLIRRPGRKSYVHPALAWMSASPDFLANDRVVECKTSAREDDWGESGSDEVPDHYLVQVQHQMMVLGLDRADIAVLIGGSDFRVFHLERNERLGAKLLSIEQDFWERYVQQRIPPAPNWTHPETPELIARMWGVDDTLRIELGEGALALAKQYDQLGEQARVAQESRAVVKAQLQHLVAHAGLARLPNGWSVVRKVVQRAGYEVGPTEYVTMRVKKPRGGD